MLHFTSVIFKTFTVLILCTCICVVVALHGDGADSACVHLATQAALGAADTQLELELPRAT